MRMSDKDKGSLLRLGYLAGVILLLVGIVKGNNYINPLYVALAFLLGQQGYVIPKLYRDYMFIHDQPNSLKRFIPLWNEVDIFPPLISAICKWLGWLQVVMIVISFLPLAASGVVAGVATTLFGDSIGMNITFYLIMWTVVVYVVSNIARGIGFIEVKRETDRIYRQNFGKIPFVPMEKVQYLLFIFPILRTLALISLVDRLRKMRMIELDAVDEDFEEQEWVAVE